MGKTIAIVPCRAGSKGLAKKNVKDFEGIPLFLWSVKAAQASSLIDTVVVSTNDREVMEVCKAENIEFVVRPDEISGDNSQSYELIRDCLLRGSYVGRFERVVLLQPTSPLRERRDIDEALLLMEKEGSASVVSVVEARHPQTCLRLSDGYRVERVIKGYVSPLRQEREKVYACNGAIYISTVEAIMRSSSFINEGTIGYVMPRERSVDIDTEIDMIIALAMKGYLEKKRC